MPYTNPYDTSLPGLGEARLLAIQAMIVASLSDLNVALNRDGLTPMTLQASQVVRGDPVKVPSSLICVVGGGERDGTDMQAEDGYFIPRTDGAGEHYTIFTNIYIFLHPDEMATDDPVLYVQRHTDALQRICDHLRKRVFNSAQGSEIVLASQEFGHLNPAGFDVLYKTYVRDVWCGMAEKNFGNSMVGYAAHLTHVAEIA